MNVLIRNSVSKPHSGKSLALQLMNNVHLAQDNQIPPAGDSGCGTAPGHGRVQGGGVCPQVWYSSYSRRRHSERGALREGTRARCLHGDDGVSTGGDD